MKPFKLGLVIGRFNHLHIKHEDMIRTALINCNKVLLLVGSSQETGTVRNPFSLHTRMNMIRESFEYEIEDGELLLAHIDDLTHEDDHSKEWGEFLLKKVNMWRGHYGLDAELDCLIFGNDEERTTWFTDEFSNSVGKIILPRSEDGISATKIRSYIAKDDYEQWQECVNPVFGMEHFEDLRDELMRIDFYKQMGETNK